MKHYKNNIHRLMIMCKSQSMKIYFQRFIYQIVIRVINQVFSIKKVRQKTLERWDNQYNNGKTEQINQSLGLKWR